MWNLRDILSALFKRKVMIIAFFLTVFIGTLVAMKLTLPSYAAVAKVLVKVGREDIYIPSLPSMTVTRPMMSIIREEQLNSEIEIIGSDYMIGLLVDELGPEGIYPSMFIKHPWYTPKGVMQGLIGLYHSMDGYFTPFSANLDPKQSVMKRLINKDIAITGTGDSNVINIVIYSKIPQFAANTANTLLDLYLRERGRIHDSSGKYVFEEQMKKNEARLESAHELLQEFLNVHNLMDVVQERDILLKRIHEVRNIIVDLDGQPSAAGRLEKWKSELIELDSQLTNLNSLELQYSQLVQNIDVLKDNRKAFLEKLEEKRLNQALADARVGNVSVVSRAVTPVNPSSPKLWMVLIAIIFVGASGGIGLALLFEFLDDTVETDRDVKKYFNLPVLGQIIE